MAEERIGASFYIDATQLKAGIKTANKLIKESESEFKKAAAGMDDWTRSEDGLNAKIKSLNSITDVQRKKVDSLKDEYKKLVADGLDETSDRAINLRTQINKEEAALAANEKELKQQKAALDALKNSTDAAGDEMDDLAKKSDKATGGFTVMKGALANLAASGFRVAINGAKKLATEFVNIGKKADDLNTLSQRSGFSTTELQKFEYAAELIDVSVDDIIGSAKKLKKNMVSNSKDTASAFETLGVSVKDAVSGELRDSTEVFYDLLGALSRVENETERDTLAMQLFGKNADALAGIIDDGGKALKEYGNEAESLGVIMSRDSVDAANKFNDAIDKIKSTGKGAFYTIGAEIAKEFTPEIETAQKKFQKFIKSADFKSFTSKAVQSLKNLGSGLIEVGKKVLPAAGKAVKFVADNFKTLATATLAAVTAFKVFKAITTVTAAATAAKVAVAGLASTVGIATKAQVAWNAAMSANPIGAVITAVALLAGGIGILASSINSTYPEVQSLSQAQRDTAAAAKEVTDAFMEQRTATDELAAANTAKVDYLRSSLLPELQNLIDANGKVKEGDEARAAFILGELNDALGTEYKSLSDIVDANGKIADSIYAAIDAKKAQILLEAYEQDYAEALKGVTAAQDEAAIAAYDLGKAQEWLENAIRSGDDETVERMKANLAEKQAAYNEADAKAKEYYRIIGDYEAASVAATEGNTQKVVDILGKYAEGFKTAADVAGKSVQEQSNILETQAMNAYLAYQLMVENNKAAWDTMTEDQQKAAEKQEEQAKKRADDAIAEWEKLGINTIEGWRRGVEEQAPFLDKTMTEIVNRALKAAKDAAGIHSPSRVFENLIGKQIGAGIALGVTDSTGSVVRAVQNQIRAIEGAYSFGGLAAMANGGTGGVNNVNNSRTVTVNQYNTYAAAHTRYELYMTKQQTAAAVRAALGV